MCFTIRELNHIIILSIFLCTDSVHISLLIEACHFTVLKASSKTVYRLQFLSRGDLGDGDGDGAHLIASRAFG